MWNPASFRRIVSLPMAAEETGRKRRLVSAESTPALPPHVKLHHDKTRERWVLLAPERLLEPDEVALGILRLCDGKTTLLSIAQTFAKSYNAPEDQILKDIEVLIQDLADKDFIRI